MLDIFAHRSIIYYFNIIHVKRQPIYTHCRSYIKNRIHDKSINFAFLEIVCTRALMIEYEHSFQKKKRTKEHTLRHL